MEMGNEVNTDKEETLLSEKKEDNQILKNIELRILPLHNRYIRYPLSLLLIGLTVLFYILYEGNRNEEEIKLIISLPTSLLVPLGILFALLGVLLLTWRDLFFTKFRSPAMFVILLTFLFYLFIFSGLDEYLFQTPIAIWLTKTTGIIIITFLKFLGLGINDITWIEEQARTIVYFNEQSSIRAIGIDSRCSGVHSLSIFITVYMLMLLEARKNIKWDYKLIIISIFGILGTYFINLLRVGIIILFSYFQGWDVAGPIHDYLGYVFLMIWLPLFWSYVLVMNKN